jgi:hypothetical protein
LINVVSNEDRLYGCCVNKWSMNLWKPTLIKGHKSVGAARDEIHVPGSRVVVYNVGISLVSNFLIFATLRKKKNSYIYLLIYMINYYMI